MTLGGLAAAIGLVIDDAIVVVENIVLHRDAGETRVEAVRKALHEISRPLIGSTVTPVVVFLPLIAVTGVTGSFFRALAITMAVSLLTSLAFGRDLDARAGDPAAQAASKESASEPAIILARAWLSRPQGRFMQRVSRGITQLWIGRFESRSGLA